jgi:hypothetical protein
MIEGERFNPYYNIILSSIQQSSIKEVSILVLMESSPQFVGQAFQDAMKVMIFPAGLLKIFPCLLERRSY